MKDLGTSPIGISTRVLIYQLRWYHRLNIAFLVCFEQMRYREVPIYVLKCSQKQRLYAHEFEYFTYIRRKWATIVAEVDPSP